MRNSERFKKVPIDKATKMPGNGFWEVFKNKYWAVTEDNCILLFRGRHPQCNANEKLVESAVKNKEHPATKIIFLSYVFLHHDCNDY